MKRIHLSPGATKAIIEIYLIHNEANFAKTGDTYKTTDGKAPDIHIHLDDDGAHIMIPNMEGGL